MFRFQITAFLSVLSVLLLQSCGGNTEIDEKTGLVNNFLIQGKIEGAPNEEMKLEAQSAQGVISVATARTDEHGQFEMRGNIPGMGIYSLSLGTNGKNAVVLPLDVNDNIVIKTTKETFAISPNVSGPK